MRHSWQTLRASGRRATRRPQGFKELDTELREDARLIEDLKHRVAYADRAPLEKTAQEIERIRNEVLQALFPVQNPSARALGLFPGITIVAIHEFLRFQVEDHRTGDRTTSFAAPASFAIPRARAQEKGDFLTDEELDKLRDAQDPSQRIEVYLAFGQARLDRFEEYRRKPADPRYDNGAYLDSLLGHYIALNEELKNWIEDQYERRGDMRRGIRALLVQGPKQLEQLRRIEKSPNAYTARYKDSLRDAIDELTDTLDGATKALGDQEKKFAETKREEKAEASASKERQKAEKKRSKEEEKLRKKQRRHGATDEPSERDDH